MKSGERVFKDFFVDDRVRRNLILKFYFFVRIPCTLIVYNRTMVERIGIRNHPKVVESEQAKKTKMRFFYLKFIIVT